MSRCLLVVVVGLALTVSASAPAAQATTADSPQVIRFDGGGRDNAGAITVDAAANIYLAGSSQAPGTDITFSAVKLNTQGGLVWRQTYSGSRGGTFGAANAVAVDDAGNVYAGGWITAGAFDTDLLVLKLNRDGVEQWAQRYDNGPFDVATEVAVDETGAVYVSGLSEGAGMDWVTQRYSSTGTLQWTRRHSGPGLVTDEVRDMALAPNGNVVVTGNTRNTGDTITNDIDVLTYNQQGAIVWQRRFTETAISDELARDLDIDPAGRITVTGSTAQNASPEVGIPTPLTLQYDASGGFLRAIRAGGEAVHVDTAGNAYVAGFFPRTRTVSTVGKFDAAGTQVWLTPLGFPDSETPGVVAIAVDTAGEVTVAGTVSDNFSSNGDYFIIRYTADGRELWRHQFNGTGDGDDNVSGLAIDGQNAALVGGTSFSGFGSEGGTETDMVTLRFPAGVTPPTPPAAPSNLIATALPRRTIQLTWQDNAGNEDGFRIERCRHASCTDFAELAVVGPNVTSFLDTGLANRTTYMYRVRAFNADGNSAYSNVAEATTRSR